MKRSGRSTHLVGVLLSGAVLIAACGSASSPLASSGAASAILNVAASPSARADADASASPTANSNAASWASPKANATVRTYKVNLSATASGPVARIEFSVASSGKLKTACLARKPDAAGTWTCTADLLKLGVMPGKISFLFDVTDAAGAVTMSPDGIRTVTYAVPPPAPTGATDKQVKTTQTSPDRTLVEYRATWLEPTGYATRFWVYGLTPCLRESAANNDRPCVVSGTTIPSSAVVVIATLDGTKRSVTISEEHGELGGGLYSAYLVRASNQFGSSTYTILWSANVCWQCVY